MSGLPQYRRLGNGRLFTAASRLLSPDVYAALRLRFGRVRVREHHPGADVDLSGDQARGMRLNRVRVTA